MPEITLLITSMNRAHLMGENLMRLRALTQPSEIIVVDDGGDDNTEHVLASAGLKLDCETRYIYTHHPGPTICSHARNIGVKAAKHEWIVTTEPEIVFKSDVLAQMVELEPEHRRQVISAGKVWFAPNRWRPRDTNNPVLRRADDYPTPDGAQTAVGWVAPYIALYKKSWLTAIGGWDESFPNSWGWDDIDLLTRLRIHGHGQHIALDMEAIHLFHGLGGDHNQANERHFLSKSFVPDESQDEDVVANRGIEWGIPIPRN